jgi:hypothetical protein
MVKGPILIFCRRILLLFLSKASYIQKCRDMLLSEAHENFCFICIWLIKVQETWKIFRDKKGFIINA